jgi:hypothetical protein
MAAPLFTAAPDQPCGMQALLRREVEIQQADSLYEAVVLAVKTFS